MSNIAIIPCRGGSKGIHMKNLQLVHGVPLVIRTIAACLEAGIDQVFVSTDDKTISEYAIAGGAHILERPKSIAMDSSSTDKVLMHAIESLLARGYSESDNLFLLQATTPFTHFETIRTAIGMLEQEPDCGVITAQDWHGFVWTVKHGTAMPHFHDPLHRSRRQDLETQILETGGLYGGSMDSFLKSKVRFVNPLRPIFVSRVEAIEIDTWDDLDFCNRITQSKAQRIQENIKVVFTDFDGVLTDNRIYQLENSESGALVNRSDGIGIGVIKANKIPIIVITGEVSGPAFGRASKLGISCIHSENKLLSIIQYCVENSIRLTEVAYIGNDLNDLGPIATCGWSFVPSDAHPDVSKYATKILRAKGGDGVLREFSDSLFS